MEFNRTDEEQRLFADAVAFARGSLADDVSARDAEGRFARDLWRRCAAYGVMGWRVPESLGGAGYPVPTATYLMEALGYACEDNGLTFGLGTQLWGVQSLLLEFATGDQIERVIPKSMSGEWIGAYAMTEAGSGSDAFALETTAVREGTDWVLNGEKVLVTFAPIADFAVVFAATDPEAGRWGLSAFLVEADTPGYEVHEVEAKMGLRTVPIGRITLDGCRVPGSALIGNEGSGSAIFTASQTWERSLVLAPQIGAMERLIERCVAFARERRRGGTPIGKHQAISHRIADMKLRLETARLLLYRTAWAHERDEGNLMHAALTKIHLSEAFVECSRDAIAIHGGSGYMAETGVERNLRDALGATLYGGTTDIQRNIVAALLGL